MKRLLQKQARASKASQEKSLFQSSYENSKAQTKSKGSLGKPTVDNTQDSVEVPLADGADEDHEVVKINEPPPLDMERIGVYSQGQRQPITSFIDNQHLRSFDSSGQAIPTRDSIQVALGVKFSEGPDSARQLAAITLGGKNITDSPEHKNKIMSKDELLSKQLSEKGEHVKSMIDRKSQIID